MSDPFIGEIRMFGGNFAPISWAFCNGQLMSIAQNDALFSLLGTTYGGDGQNTFALPNMQSRFPVHMGTSTTGRTYTIGEQSGTETVSLITSQIPAHNHIASANSGGGNSNDPTNNKWATSSTNIFSTAPPDTAMGATSITGGSQPHENMSPYLCVNFIICLEGIYPSRN